MTAKHLSLFSVFFIVLFSTSLHAQITLQVYNTGKQQWEDRLQINGELIMSKSGAEWVNQYWWDSKQSVLKNAPAGTWQNYLWSDYSSGIMKKSENGQWVSQFWIDPQKPDQIQAVSDGKWLPLYKLEGDVLKKMSGGEWAEYIRFNGGMPDLLFLSCLLFDLN